MGPATLFVGVSFVMIYMAFLSILLSQYYIPSKRKLTLGDELQIFRQTILHKIMVVPYSAIFALNFNLAIVTTPYTIALKSMGYTDVIIGMLFGVMVIFSIIVYYPAGLLGDKIGKKEILVTGF